MKISHLFAIVAILICTTIAWFTLGGTLELRTNSSDSTLSSEVHQIWGPELCQEHPSAWFESPNAINGIVKIDPSKSAVQVSLVSEPKHRGLMWYRTYLASFSGDYTFTNPTKIPQTLYINFALPRNANGLTHSEFSLDGETENNSLRPDTNGNITRAIHLPASASVTLHSRYQTHGSNSWLYRFNDNRRISQFNLTLNTNFMDYSFPLQTGSPSTRSATGEGGMTMIWDYPNDLSVQNIGMDMPKQLNAGPVASRIAFFAPVSLLLFITVIILTAGIRNFHLHPMHIFFVAAGFFAFHLTFAYLVDLLPIFWSFLIASICSLTLVTGYLTAIVGKPFIRIALPTQIVYLIAFSGSFFMDGITGICITLLGIITLAILMVLTVKTDWSQFFQTRKPEPPQPNRAPISTLKPVMPPTRTPPPIPPATP